MKLLKIFLVITLLLTIIIPASAIILYFYDGNEYLKLSESAKLSYVAGLSDMAGFLILRYDIVKSTKIWNVTKNMTIGQVVKILNKYLEEHPEELHLSVAFSYLNAIDEIVFKE
jgi:hypothetical protein